MNYEYKKYSDINIFNNKSNAFTKSYFVCINLLTFETFHVGNHIFGKWICNSVKAAINKLTN